MEENSLKEKENFKWHFFKNQKNKQRNTNFSKETIKRATRNQKKKRKSWTRNFKKRTRKKRRVKSKKKDRIFDTTIAYLRIIYGFKIRFETKTNFLRIKIGQID